jgi:hypothetical protein
MWGPCTLELHVKVKENGKVTDHEGGEGEERYKSTLPLFSALNGGGWLTPRPGRFTPATETRDPL